MNPIVHRYIDRYLEGISHAKDLSTPENNFTIFLQELISKNDTLHDKYYELFDMDIMEEEYGEDVEGFKNSIKKECDVIHKTLQSRSEALNEWKSKFYGCKAQVLYDTFYNMISYAAEYDDEMDEATMVNLNTVEACRLVEMEEDACYKSGVLGFGIVSNILNHMYPRIFSGNYKAGVWSLYFYLRALK